MRTLRVNMYGRMSRAKKITVLLLLVLAISLIGAAFFYANVQGQHWAEMDAAGKAAANRAGLKEVTRVEPSYGDDAYHIVFGKDAEGKALVVWVSANDIHVEQAEGTFTEDQARAELASREPAANLLRVLPNRMQGQYVWEMFYTKLNEQGETRYYYDYYRFTDGTYLDTYRLSL